MRSTSHAPLAPGLSCKNAQRVWIPDQETWNSSVVVRAISAQLIELLMWRVFVLGGWFSSLVIAWLFKLSATTGTKLDSYLMLKTFFPGLFCPETSFQICHWSFRLTNYTDRRWPLFFCFEVLGLCSGSLRRIWLVTSLTEILKGRSNPRVQLGWYFGFCKKKTPELCEQVHADCWLCRDGGNVRSWNSPTRDSI